MDFAEFSRVVTIHGRVAFVLCIAEPALVTLRDEPGYCVCVQAYREAVRWESGEQADADTLTDLLHDADDRGVLVYETECPDGNAKKAYVLLGAALGYVAWRMYRTAGQVPDALVSEFTDDDIQHVLDWATAAPTYDYDYVRRLYEYLMSHHRIATGDETGVPIDIQTFKSSLRV